MMHAETAPPGAAAPVFDEAVGGDAQDEAGEAAADTP